MKQSVVYGWENYYLWFPHALSFEIKRVYNTYITVCCPNTIFGYGRLVNNMNNIIESVNILNEQQPIKAPPLLRKGAWPSTYAGQSDW